MFPGVDPRQMKAMMKKLGIQEQQIPATEVIIRTPDKDLIISQPQVSLIKMMGQSTYQVIGEAQEVPHSTTPTIEEEDIQTIIDQTGVDEETAKKALEESNGDLAEAILKLQSED